MQLCRLCLTESEAVIQVFSKHGKNLNIAAVLSKHFWFQVTENDCISTVICTNCWSNTSQFNDFYGSVQQAQLAYFKESPFIQFDDKDVTPKPIMPVKAERPIGSDVLLPEIASTTANDDSAPFDWKIESDLSESICESINNHEANENSKPKDDSTSLITYSELKTEVEPPVTDDHNFSNDDSDEDFSPAESTDSDSTDDEAIKSAPKRILVKKSASGDRTSENTEALRKSMKREKRRREDDIIRKYCNMYCDLCTAPHFQTFTDAVKHYKLAHQIRGYLSCCGRNMFRRNTVLDHIHLHDNPDAYRCPICALSLSNKRSLKNHLDVHKSDDQKPFKCALCSHKYTKESLLNRHMFQSHCKEEDKKLTCYMCDKKFLIQSQLTAHIKRHNAIPIVCDICGKNFKSKYSLAVHRTETHLCLDTPKQQCNVCGVWLKETYLPKHVKRHAAKLETCTICGKVLQNKNSMGNHMRNVHGNQVHECKVCGKGFRKTISLKEHLALHTGEDLYTCPYCTMTFKSGANMHSHRKKAHYTEWSQDRGKRLVSPKN